MPQTLATFKIEDQQWNAFKQATKADNSNASETIKAFIQWYLSGNRLNAEVNVSEIDIDQRIESRLIPLINRIAELEGKLPA
ncbi:hypothetical protein [Fischerella sp. PCC 9605]|uniref:hypothetical protein n=1 Tax=Fischerella sp. PCC 9605 TaxID=1173024 RepID=UPI00047A29A7|nr:hypothetical protein [Fischerella sp. PCC 9605]